MKKLLILLVFSLLCMGCGSSTQQAIEKSYSSLMNAAGMEKADFIDKGENSFIGLGTCSWYTEKQILENFLESEKAENISNLKVEVVKEDQDLAEAKITYDENGKTESGRRLFRIKDGKAYLVMKNITEVSEIGMKPVKELEMIMKTGTIYPTGDTLYFLRLRNNSNTGIALGWTEESRMHFETDQGRVSPSSVSYAGEVLFSWQPGHMRIQPHDTVWFAIPVKGTIKAKSLVLEQVYFLGPNGLPMDIGAPPVNLTLEFKAA